MSADVKGLGVPAGERERTVFRDREMITEYDTVQRWAAAGLLGSIVGSSSPNVCGSGCCACLTRERSTRVARSSVATEGSRRRQWNYAARSAPPAPLLRRPAMAFRCALRSGAKLLKSQEAFISPSVPLSRGIHSTGVKRMGGHGHDSEPYYLHAKHMYNLDRMKHQKLKVTLGVLSAFSLGVAVPIYAVIFQQKKTASA